MQCATLRTDFLENSTVKHRFVFVKHRFVFVKHRFVFAEYRFVFAKYRFTCKFSRKFNCKVMVCEKGFVNCVSKDGNNLKFFVIFASEMSGRQIINLINAQSK